MRIFLDVSQTANRYLKNNFLKSPSEKLYVKFYNVRNYVIQSQLTQHEHRSHCSKSYQQ